MDYPGKVITKTQVTPTQTSASGNWTLDDQAAAIKNNNWPVALVPNPISKSLRFNSADSAYLNRTPASASNRKTWTWSGWVKRSALVAGTIFGAGATNGNNFVMYFESDDTLVMLNWTSFVDNFRLKTTQVFRDVSAWYHIVAVLDTTQATSSNRVKLYLNGTQITVLTTATYPTQNFDSTVNTAAVHTLGARSFDAPSLGFNGYMTEINFIDGQQLTPSSFGMTNPQTGQWIPLKYSGTYGTNGFYLNFKDATSTTTLGLDYSGNANNWTTNNFSVTAGVGNDSLTDVPTPWFAYNTTGDVGGVIRGNYATFNPINLQGSNTSGTVTDGNLKSNPSASAGYTNYLSSIAVPATGYWYAEFTVSGTYQGANNNYVGIQLASSKSTTFIGNEATTYGYADGNITTGSFRNNGTISQSVAGFQTGDTLMVAIGNGGVWFGKNGTWLGTGSPNPATSTSPAYSGLSGDYYFAYSAYGTAGVTYGYSSYANFGQRPFAYTPPTGFRSLCTTNLPATAIGFGLTNQGNNYFDATTYTGTGTTLSITNSGSMQPDFVWIKIRSLSFSHNLQDAVRGSNKVLLSDLTSAEQTQNAGHGVTSFNSNGFTLGLDSSTTGSVNANGGTFVAWQWRAAGSTVTNTAGTITSTVSANTTAGFSVVTFTSPASGGFTFGHGLSVTPGMFILKDRTNAGTAWGVWHQSLANTAQSYLQLNSTNAVAANANIWNNTAPTSTLISTQSGQVVLGSANCVAYCFAAVPGYSAFGSYTGNNSADGPFIYLGFRPAFVLIKTSNTTQWWTLLDNKRDTYNVATLGLSPNSSDSETTFNTNRGPHNMDFVSNGLKIRTDNSAVNGTNTFIYAAFAEYPFQFANAR
jgi:hypothetical protein